MSRNSYWLAVVFASARALALCSACRPGLPNRHRVSGCGSNVFFDKGYFKLNFVNGFRSSVSGGTLSSSFWI